jgi:hypothetical protein
VYEIPSGYTGWVLIEFERPDAPPLQKRDGKLVFHIGGDGRMATSSKCEFGWSHDEYAYVGTTPVELKRTAWGGGGQIWAGSNGGTQTAGQKPQTYETFFVGSEAAFKSAGKDPSPSSADIQLTRQITEAGRAIDIPCLDHIVIGRRSVDALCRGYYSFREAGLI